MFLNKNIVYQLQTKLAKRLKKPSLFILIINLVNKNGGSVQSYCLKSAQDHSSCAYNNWIAQLFSIGVEWTQGYFTSKKRFFPSSNLLVLFLTFLLKLGGFLLINFLIFSAVYPRPVLQELLFNEALFQKIGFSSQFHLIGIGGFLSTLLSHFPIFQLKFWSF